MAPWSATTLSTNYVLLRYWLPPGIIQWPPESFLFGNTRRETKYLMGIALNTRHTDLQLAISSQIRKIRFAIAVRRELKNIPIEHRQSRFLEDSALIAIRSFKVLAENSFARNASPFSGKIKESLHYRYGGPECMYNFFRHRGAIVRV